MKSILDSSFKYRPSFDTDVRKTFSKARREQQAQIRAEQQGPASKERVVGQRPILSWPAAAAG
jgi:hypothetical protein